MLRAVDCCFCGGPVEDGLFVELRGRWSDSYDSVSWDAHESSLRRALHPERWDTPFRGASGRSAIATYLEEGPGEDVRAMALAAGFARPEGYPADGMPDDFLDLEDVLLLTDCAQVRDLDQLLFGARLWAPAALASVVEEAKRRGVVPWAVLADVVAIIALLANPMGADRLSEETNFSDELAEAISVAAVEAQASIPRVLCFRLVLPSGAWVDEPDFLTTVQNWRVGERFSIASGREFRILAINDEIDAEGLEELHRQGLNALWKVEPVNG